MIDVSQKSFEVTQGKYNNICQDKISHEIIHGSETHQAAEEMSSFLGNGKIFDTSIYENNEIIKFEFIRTIPIKRKPYANMQKNKLFKNLEDLKLKISVQ